MPQTFGLEARHHLLPEVREFLGVIHERESGARDTRCTELFQLVGNSDRVCPRGESRRGPQRIGHET